MLLELIGIASIGLYAKRKYQNRHKKKTGNTDSEVEKTSIKSRKKRIVPFLGGRHSQLLEEFSDENNAENQVEKLNNRYLNIALISFGFTIVGKFVYFPLTLLSLPGIVYIAIPPFLSAYNTLIKEKKASIDLVFVMGQMLLVVNGFYLFACVPALFFAINRKLLFKITNQSKNNLVGVFKQQPQSVWIVHNELELEVPFGHLKIKRYCSRSCRRRYSDRWLYY